MDCRTGKSRVRRLGEGQTEIYLKCKGASTVRPFSGPAVKRVSNCIRRETQHRMPQRKQLRLVSKSA